MLRGHQLKRIRILKGIIQQEVADAINVKRAYISMLENEQQPIPSSKYKKWVEFLNSNEAKQVRDERLKKKSKNQNP